LDDAINTDGVPFPILSDRTTPNWLYNDQKAVAAANLVNQFAQMKGHGVEATALTVFSKLMPLRRMMMCRQGVSLLGRNREEWSILALIALVPV
jgi:hypothetical protein